MRLMSTTHQDAMKLAAASAALPYVIPRATLGVGSGSTVNAFISLLAPLRHQIIGAVAASEASAKALRAVGIPVLNLNDVAEIPYYFDSADEIDASFAMIKGGGAALTREKIIASASDKFICLIDASKQVEQLGAFPLPIEVIPFATSLVVRRLFQLGARATPRAGVVTDNGNQLLDVVGLPFADSLKLETELNQIPGVVCNGIFARRPADICICAKPSGVEITQRPTMT